MSRHFVLVLLVAAACSDLMCSAFSQQPSSYHKKDQAGIVASNVSLQVDGFLSATQFSQLATATIKWKDVQPDEKRILVQELQSKLSSTRRLVLVESADAVVRHRLEKGEMVFHGHGLILDQDIFIEGGRAAWALEQMLDVKLPTITEGMSQHDLSNGVQRIKSTIDARVAAQEGVGLNNPSDGKGH